MLYNATMNVLHPIPYQGSKRKLAPAILAFFPPSVCRLIEPFAGSAAVSIAALTSHRAKCVVLNDSNKPLMKLWEEIVYHPDRITSEYSTLWHSQLGKEREFYDSVRARFNQTQQPSDLLYLLARCVKASVRYNSGGKFNQSPDNRRRGMNPTTLAKHILDTSQLMKDRVTILSSDYTRVLEQALPDDVVYMDPPYQGVCGNRDQRYLAGLDFDQFVGSLNHLNQAGISFIVSYDGRTGPKTFGHTLPNSLNLKHVEVSAGRSTQATLLGRNYDTYESLYISPSLVARTLNQGPASVLFEPNQLFLFERLPT